MVSGAASGWGGKGEKSGGCPPPEKIGAQDSVKFSLRRNFFTQIEDFL